MSLQHGFTVQRTGDSDLDRLQQRVKDALDRIAQTATKSQLADNTRYITVGAQNIQDSACGPDIPSANTMAFTAAYHDVTGTTTVNFASIAGWFDGARVELAIVTGPVTFNNQTASPPAGAYSLHTLTGAPVSKAGGTVIAFRRVDRLKLWLQVA